MPKVIFSTEIDPKDTGQVALSGWLDSEPGRWYMENSECKPVLLHQYDPLLGVSVVKIVGTLTEEQLTFYRLKWLL